MKSNNLDLVRIFAPEHGYLGNHPAGKNIKDNIDPISGAEVISLYGKNKAPLDKHLQDIDIIIFDIQDIGARYYTYISTMTLVMESAAKNNIDFFILDRPNPLSGKVEGSILDINYSSFVGMHQIPVRHGMTIGEIALFIKDNKQIKNSENLKLSVIKMKNWNRFFLFDKYYKTWNSPSPNIPNLETALIYTGMCLLEGTNISEGRGTDSPFKIFGAPWLNSKRLVKKLNKYNFQGVVFSVDNFLPVSIKGKVAEPKYENILCHGVRVIIIDKHQISPFLIALAIINEVSQLHPENFKFKVNFFDKLYGSNEFRNIIGDSAAIENLINQNNHKVNNFISTSKEYLLY